MTTYIKYMYKYIHFGRTILMREQFHVYEWCARNKFYGYDEEKKTVHEFALIY